MEQQVVSPSPEISRRHGQAEINDLALAWVVVAVAGAAAIWVLADPNSPWFMGVPIALMLIYLLFAWSRAQYSSQRVGDSLYFLGFLWTLVTLIATVIRRQDVTAAAVLVVFSYALTTTAFGLFLRMALLQFQRTVDDQETLAVDSLDTHVRRLTDELTNAEAAVRQLSANATATLVTWKKDLDESRRTILQDTMDANRKMIADEAAALRQGLQAVAIESESLRDVVRQLRLALTHTAKGVDISGRKLVGSIDGMVRRTESSTVAAHQTFEDLRTRVQAIAIPEDLLTTRVDALAGRTSADLERLSSLVGNAARTLQLRLQGLIGVFSEIPGRAEAEGALKQLTEQVREVASALSHVRSALVETGRSSSTLSAVAVKAATDVRKFEEASRQATENLQQSAQADVQRLSGIASQLNDCLNESKQSVIAVDRTLREVVDFVKRRLGESR